MFSLLDHSVDFDWLLADSNITTTANCDDIDSITEFFLDRAVCNIEPATPGQHKDWSTPINKPHPKTHAKISIHFNPVAFAPQLSAKSTFISRPKSVDLVSMTCCGYSSINSPPPKA